jgi:hypothetical protein
MKASDKARGDALAAVSVKVSDGFFLMALSGSAPDAALNLRLLGTRDLIDLPIVYASGERAVLALEKGNAGTKAFGRAIRAWTPPGGAPGQDAARP